MTDIKIDALRSLCEGILLKTGLSQDHATIVIDHYLENELSGKTSHGMVRVIQVANAIEKIGLPKKAPETIISKTNMALINGNMNLGPVVGKMVMDQAISLAKEHGISLVGANTYFGNTGSMAYYLRRLADEGLIGLMSCSSECMVAAPDGKERLLGTNPIGLGVPSDEGNHFIADFATSAIAYGKILVAMDKGEPIPTGCIIDKDGNPSTDPKDAAQDGAILPLADYRGFALGLFVEMIGLMLGGEVLHNETYGKDALFIISIDPAHLGGAHYSKRVCNILNTMRQSTPAPHKNSVNMPGDRSSARLHGSIQRGSIDVADKTLEKLKALA
ncbi:MAG: Ldh family oxidoreductase [Alphaproteobacteria bacterium]|nr:Ldh family oxidoreductase [Alphaproteobacteria bacterium]NCQ88176.1 Ldh family oxidoreductase [Alphaproteobacteria bacterium]NCT05317.1 Ldh family oxidoreductase [Alphaproteobacteria bacterium]